MPCVRLEKFPIMASRRSFINANNGEIDAPGEDV